MARVFIAKEQGQHNAYIIHRYVPHDCSTIAHQLAPMVRYHLPPINLSHIPSASRMLQLGFANNLKHRTCRRRLVSQVCFPELC